MSTGRPTYSVRRIAFKKPPDWEGHLLAKDSVQRREYWHPRLAKEFADTYEIEFRDEDEIGKYRGSFTVKDELGKKRF